MNLSFDPSAQLLEPVQNFVKQSERVLNVTHKPRKHEFTQIAYVTAIGMAVVGLIGFVISMSAHFMRVARF